MKLKLICVFLIAFFILMTDAGFPKKAMLPPKGAKLQGLRNKAGCEEPKKKILPPVAPKPKKGKCAKTEESNDYENVGKCAKAEESNDYENVGKCAKAKESRAYAPHSNSNDCAKGEFPYYEEPISVDDNKSDVSVDDNKSDDDLKGLYATVDKKAKQANRAAMKCAKAEESKKPKKGPKRELCQKATPPPSDDGYQTVGCKDESDSDSDDNEPDYVDLEDCVPPTVPANRDQRDNRPPLPARPGPKGGIQRSSAVVSGRKGPVRVKQHVTESDNPLYESFD